MITINGNILENRYTTAQWAAITAVLPDRVWGHEVDASGNPVGSKMGDGIHLWAALGYWYEKGANYEVAVTAATGKVINWQTDLIDGVITYAAALGNNIPKPMHYFFDSGTNTYTRGGVEPTIVRVSGLITTVTFAWGYSADSLIVF